MRCRYFIESLIRRSAAYLCSSGPAFHPLHIGNDVHELSSDGLQHTVLFQQVKPYSSLQVSTPAGGGSCVRGSTVKSPGSPPGKAVAIKRHKKKTAPKSENPEPEEREIESLINAYIGAALGKLYATPGSFFAYPARSRNGPDAVPVVAGGSPNSATSRTMDRRNRSDARSRAGAVELNEASIDVDDVRARIRRLQRGPLGIAAGAP